MNKFQCLDSSISKPWHREKDRLPLEHSFPYFVTSNVSIHQNRFPSPSHFHFIHPMFFPHYRMNVKLWKVPSELHRNVIYISSELPKENEGVLSNSLITAEFSLLIIFFNYMKTVKPE